MEKGKQWTALNSAGGSAKTSFKCSLSQAIRRFCCCHFSNFLWWKMSNNYKKRKSRENRTMSPYLPWVSKAVLLETHASVVLLL